MLEYDEILFWLAAGILLYVLAAYPLLVYLIGRLRPAPRPHDEETLPSVTVVIPARNEEAVLAGKLQNTLTIAYPSDRLEVIVASDGSTDGTVEIAQGFADGGIRVLAFPDWRGKASTLNRVIEQANGEVLCLCDANVMFRPDALRCMVRRLSDERTGAVTGDVRLASDEASFGRGESLYYRLERWLQAVESRAGSVMGVDGGMYVVRKELFRPLPADTILDDFVISMDVIRQGRRVVFEPRAVAVENGTTTACQEFHRRVRVASGAVQSLKRGQWPPWRRLMEVWQYVSHKLLRWLGPVWLLVLLVSNICLWKQGGVYQASLVGQGMFYLAAGAASLSLRFRRTTLGGIAFYFTMSHVAMGIGLVKGLFWKQRGTWKRTERATASVGHQELQLTRDPS